MLDLSADCFTLFQRFTNRPDISEEVLEEMVSIKMGSGLLSLQLIDISLLDIAVNGGSSVSHYFHMIQIVDNKHC